MLTEKELRSLEDALKSQIEDPVYVMGVDQCELCLRLVKRELAPYNVEELRLQIGNLYQSIINARVNSR